MIDRQELAEMRVSHPLALSHIQAPQDDGQLVLDMKNGLKASHRQAPLEMMELFQAAYRAESSPPLPPSIELVGPESE
jgi:hypothetical protein